jgi:hypothetical protein
MRVRPAGRMNRPSSTSPGWTAGLGSTRVSANRRSRLGRASGGGAGPPIPTTARGHSKRRRRGCVDTCCPSSGNDSFARSPSVSCASGKTTCASRLATTLSWPAGRCCTASCRQPKMTGALRPTRSAKSPRPSHPSTRLALLGAPSAAPTRRRNSGICWPAHRRSTATTSSPQSEPACAPASCSAYAPAA